MSTPDIFNFNVDVKEKQIIAVRNCAVDIGDGKIALVQSFQGSYQQNVQPVYEAGSSALYFVNGNPTGQFTLSTVVGTNGWFSFLSGNTGFCGALRTINMDLLRDNPLCDAEVTMHKNLKFEGAALQNISFQGGAGQLQITNSATFTCAKMLRA